MITSAEQFRALRMSDDPEEQRRASMEPAAPNVWEAVLTNYPDLRFWVAQNKTVPVGILGQLAQDPDARVRDMVASKRSLPEPLQVLLAQDSDVGVVASLARNPRLTLPVRKMLSVHADPSVREALRLHR